MTVRRPANPPTRPPATEIALEQLGRRAGNGSFKEIQLVEDALHVLDSETPDAWYAGIVQRKAHCPRVEIGGSNYHEALSSPEVDQRAVQARIADYQQSPCPTPAAPTQP
jgi:hypothetical protein